MSRELKFKIYNKTTRHMYDCETLKNSTSYYEKDQIFDSIEPGTVSGSAQESRARLRHVFTQPEVIEVFYGI